MVTVLAAHSPYPIDVAPQSPAKLLERILDVNNTRSSSGGVFPCTYRTSLRHVYNSMSYIDKAVFRFGLPLYRTFHTNTASSYPPRKGRQDYPSKDQGYNEVSYTANTPHDPANPFPVNAETAHPICSIGSAYPLPSYFAPLDIPPLSLLFASQEYLPFACS